MCQVCLTRHSVARIFIPKMTPFDLAMSYDDEVQWRSRFWFINKSSQFLFGHLLEAYKHTNRFSVNTAWYLGIVLQHDRYNISPESKFGWMCMCFHSSTICWSDKSTVHIPSSRFNFHPRKTCILTQLHDFSEWVIRTRSWQFDSFWYNQLTHSCFRMESTVLTHPQ